MLKSLFSAAFVVFRNTDQLLPEQPCKSILHEHAHFHPILSGKSKHHLDISRDKLTRDTMRKRRLFFATCGLDMARTALRSDPEQNVSPAPRRMRPLPSAQFSSWVTLSSRSTIMLPGRREKKKHSNNELDCRVILCLCTNDKLCDSSLE